jgi:hypothetical protein
MRRGRRYGGSLTSGRVISPTSFLRFGGEEQRIGLCAAGVGRPRRLCELARIEGRELEAERLYQESIRLAREARFVQIEAIAAECAARYSGRESQTDVFALVKSNSRTIAVAVEGKVNESFGPS